MHTNLRQVDIFLDLPFSVLLVAARRGQAGVVHLPPLHWNLTSNNPFDSGPLISDRVAQRGLTVRRQSDTEFNRG